MKDFWNNRYADSAYAYGIHPNAFFKNELDRLTPGRLLLPAEGEGRNAVYAARRGWEVHAFDYSETAREKALRLAEAHNVEIDYRLAAYEEIDWPEKSFDCLALIFAHLPAEKRRTYYRKLTAYLKPGATLLLEAFAKAQLGRDSGGPKNLAMLFSREELEEDLAGLPKLRIEEAETELDEGPFHRGSAAVIRVVGRR